MTSRAWSWSFEIDESESVEASVSTSKRMVGLLLAKTATRLMADESASTLILMLVLQGLEMSPLYAGKAPSTRRAT